MRSYWIKLIAGSFAAEILAILILVLLVSIFGPNEIKSAQAYAEKLGHWVGPIAGAILSFLGALWIARPFAAGQTLRGASFGMAMALFDTALLVAMQAPFEWIFLISDTGKIITAVAGGYCAARLRASAHDDDEN